MNILRTIALPILLAISAPVVVAGTYQSTDPKVYMEPSQALCMGLKDYPTGITLRIPQYGPPAANSGKFTVRLLHAMSQPLHVDFFHRQRAKMAVALFTACQRCVPGEIGPIGDDMRKR